VTPAFIQDMKKAGFTGATVEDMVRARDPRREARVRRGDPAHGPRRHHASSSSSACATTASRWSNVKALESQGFKNVPVEDIVRTKDHGVSAEFVADMKEIGLKDLTLPQLVRLRDHGITPGFVNHARARGYKTTDPEEPRPP